MQEEAGSRKESEAGHEYAFSPFSFLLSPPKFTVTISQLVSYYLEHSLIARACVAWVWLHVTIRAVSRGNPWEQLDWPLIQAILKTECTFT